MSKLLVKLVDNAIMPAVVLGAGKVIGLLAPIFVLGLDYELKDSTSLIPYDLVFSNTQDVILVNTISNVLLVVLVSAGLIYSFMKVHQFNDKRVSPDRVMKLAEKNLLSMIESSINLYARAVVWVIFSVIISLLVGVHGMDGLSPAWLMWLSLVVTLVSIMYLVKNIELDYTKVKAKVNKK